VEKLSFRNTSGGALHRLNQSPYHEDAVERRGALQDCFHGSFAIIDDSTSRAGFLEQALDDFL
jgi:hypothetical protein